MRETCAHGDVERSVVVKVSDQHVVGVEDRLLGERHRGCYDRALVRERSAAGVREEVHRLEVRTGPALDQEVHRSVPVEVAGDAGP